jgi:hypothetical protein
MEITIRLEGFEDISLRGRIVKTYDDGRMDVALRQDNGQVWPDGYPHTVRTLKPKEVVFGA